ncbi:MAG: acetyltransferase [Bdellovibrionaceae bacterium]|nr:acetyltransferase [Pseudobdellovibrionaceae bacterium]
MYNDIIFSVLALFLLYFIYLFRSHFFLLPAWFFPHKGGRVFFHKLRGVKISSGVEIGYMVSIDNVHPDKVVIYEGATVVLGSVILSHDNAHHKTTNSKKNIQEVRIGVNSFVGANSIILPGVRIGEGAIVSAGSVVNNSVPDYAVVGGNPAVILYKLK